jgi:hypothetical protein
MLQQDTEVEVLGAMARSGGGCADPQADKEDERKRYGAPAVAVMPRLSLLCHATPLAVMLSYFVLP